MRSRWCPARALSPRPPAAFQSAARRSRERIALDMIAKAQRGVGSGRCDVRSGCVVRAAESGQSITGSVPVAVSVAVALLVAGAALLFAGHRDSRSTAAAHVSPAPRTLVSRLAVLRRPQTSADRSLSSTALAPSARNPFGYAVPSLTRLARVLPDGSRLLLVVLKRSPHSGFTSDALAVATVSATGQDAWMVGPTSLESVKANRPARARPEFPSLRPFTPRS